MDKLKRYIKRLDCSGFLTAIAFAFVTVAANTTCMCLYYQPELPDEVKKFRNKYE